MLQLYMKTETQIENKQWILRTRTLLAECARQSQSQSLSASFAKLHNNHAAEVTLAWLPLQGLQPPRPATGVSRALRARSVPGVSLGVSLGPFAPRVPQCPKSVPRVSPECQKGVPDTLGTLSGHFLDTPEPGARRAPETPRGTLPGHFGPEGRERLL